MQEGNSGQKDKPSGSEEKAADTSGMKNKKRKQAKQVAMPPDEIFWPAAAHKLDAGTAPN